MLIYFQSFCIVALEIFCCKIFFETFCEVRYTEKKLRNNMIIFILILLIYGTAIFLADNLVIKEVVIVGVTATVMYRYLQINLLKSFLLSGLFHALLLLVDYLTLLLAVTFFEGITQLGQEYIIEGVLTIVLAKTVLFLRHHQNVWWRSCPRRHTPSLFCLTIFYLVWMLGARVSTKWCLHPCG